MKKEEWRARMQELGLSEEALAYLSGVPLPVVRDILDSEENLSGTAYAEEEAALEKVLKTAYQVSDSPSVMHLEDPQAAYEAKQGKYTPEDYFALPDERRAELIDGDFYDMAGPSLNHQYILLQLSTQFDACAKAHGGPCMVHLAPCDLRLGDDVFQPDLFVYCGEKKSTHVVYEAPELTLEILSDSTRSKDLLLKREKYEKAGVKEYWIVDPERKEVLVYCFAEGKKSPEKYTFRDQISVRVSGGRCRIDFASISEYLGL